MGLPSMAKILSPGCANSELLFMAATFKEM
jgi:hypothetical protein